MDRVERTGIGIAAAGHVALFAALSLGLFAARNKMPTQPDPIEVSFVDNIGLKSAASKASPEAPAPSVAPEIAKPDEVPPPQLEIAKPKPAAKPPAPTLAAAPDKPDRRRPVSIADAMQAVAATAKAERKPTGSRLGANFLKGLSPEKTEGKANAAQAAAVSAQAMASLAGAIAAQVKPCYTIPSGGTDVEQIVTVLRLRFNPDGSVASTPAVVEHHGVSGSNQSYVRQMDDAARRAVLRCAPLRLPAQFYAGGWEDILFTFRPEAMD